MATFTFPLYAAPVASLKLPSNFTFVPLGKETVDVAPEEMVEVLVWLLIALPSNASVSGSVATFKTKDACEAVRVEMRYTPLTLLDAFKRIFL